MRTRKHCGVLMSVCALLTSALRYLTLNTIFLLVVALTLDDDLLNSIATPAVTHPCAKKRNTLKIDFIYK